MSNDTVTLKINDEEQEVSLEEIAGIDMDDIEENEGGFEATPAGVYLFKCTNADLDKLGDGAAIIFELEIEECRAAKGDTDPDDMVGKTHREIIFLSDGAKDIGKAKYLMSHAGYSGKGSLEQLLDGFVGTRFVAQVKQRAKKTDPDTVYANIVAKTIEPAQ